MKPKIIFHIGFEKTGTDSFQRFCKENYRALLKFGVLYPTKSLAYGQSNHGPLVSCYLPYRDFNIGPAGRKQPAILRSLRREADKTKPKTILISAEHFSSRFREEQIRELASDFADHDCRIVIGVREHRSRIYSAYSQTIKNGRSLTLDEFCTELFDPKNPYIRYRDTITPWENTFGKENISVLASASGVNIVRVLCETVSPEAASALDTSSYWDNKALGAVSIEALRMANKALYGQQHHDVSKDNYLKWLVLRLAHLRLRTLIARAAGDEPQGKFSLSEASLQRLKQITDIDNPWLESGYGIRLTTTTSEGDPAQDTMHAQAAELLARALVCQMKWWPWAKLLDTTGASASR